MGKIFDALEKADQELTRARPVTSKESRGKVRDASDEKVVSLVNTDRYANNRQLDPSLITYHSPQSVESELFKVLRTNLLFPQKGKPPKTILVTSAMPGDGKSLISANLAVSIAQGVEEYVLLIDSDIRKPTIHKIFGLQQTNGLSEYLANEHELPGYLLKSSIPKLSILPGGEPPANPTELLTSKKMKALLKEVAGRYEDRFIIIDSPPPSMASETSAIAKLVDGVIVVVKKSKTPKKAVTELIEQIDKEKLLGIVFNFSDRSANKYYGYGKSYYRAGKKRNKS